MPKIFRCTALAVALVLAACSGGGDEDGAGGPTKTTGAAAKTEDGKSIPSRFKVTAAEVQAMAPQAPAFPEDVKAQVTAALDSWLEQAVVRPLESGKAPTGGLDALFTAAALARLSAPGADRAALLEDGTVTGKVNEDRANTALTALTDGGGAVVLVTAQLDVAQTVKTDDGAVAVVRTGEVVLVPAEGWRIDAYTVRTARDSVAGAGK